MNIEEKVAILEAALEEIEKNSSAPSDGNWLEELTVKVGPMLREWDLSSCVGSKYWEDKQKYFPEHHATVVSFDIIGHRAQKQSVLKWQFRLSPTPIE